MDSKKIMDLILQEVNTKCSLEISEFLQSQDLDNLKPKEIVKLLEKSHDNSLLLGVNEDYVYSYEFVYNYCKLKLFSSLKDQKEFDLGSEDFEAFNPKDLIEIFNRINVEIFDYLLENI